VVDKSDLKGVFVGGDNREEEFSMKAEYIPKVQWVSQEYMVSWRGGTKKRWGPYWYGYWWENGGTRRVYIGKELPEYLGYLLEKRGKRAAKRA